MKLSNRYKEALEFTFDLHSQMERKSSPVPFLAHLLSTSTIVLEAGGTEDQAIAALLHDAIEDAGGVRTEEEIARRFGKEVAQNVRDVSDTDEQPKPPWRMRKEAYLKHLETASENALIVSCADKIDNLRSLIAAYKVKGEDLWADFNAPKEEQIWVYGEYVLAFNERLQNRTLANLALDTYRELMAQVGHKPENALLSFNR